MKTNLNTPYLPGKTNLGSFPLSRFLPPIQEGMASAWLNANVPSGAWVLDPLGIHPALDLEAARAGYRVLVSCNNPIMSHLLTVYAQAPQRDDLLAALAELGSVRRGQERLESELSALYLTHCDVCKRSIPVEAFLWKRAETQPFARLYQCPHCGDHGERPITPADLEKLQTLGSGRLHFARALERVNLNDTSLTEGAKEALEVYLTRPLYFLFTIINKLEGMPLSKERRQLLTAMAILTCDQGNALWPWPTPRSRPLQLAAPPQFRENNLWTALENSVELLSSSRDPVPLTIWPEISSQPGSICLIKGKLKEVLPLPPEIELRGVVAAVPRSTQAFWTLCALWSGWIWGPEAVQPLKSALERQRYGWSWHSVALHSVFKYLRQAAPASGDFPAFGLLPDLSPGFLSATLLGVQSSGFCLRKIALNEEEKTAQLTWQPCSDPQTNAQEPFKQLNIQPVQDFLTQNGEPARYLRVHAALLTDAAAQRLLPEALERLPFDTLSQLNTRIEKIFEHSGQLKRFDGSPQTHESGWWWLRQPPSQAEQPLSDRMEKFIVEWMVAAQRPFSAEDVFSALCKEFSGLSTPNREFTQVCLESYAAPLSTSPDLYVLNENDLPAQRQKDIVEIQQLLQQIGSQLGFLSHGQQPLIWKEKPSGQSAYLFHCFASGIISRFVFSQQSLPPEACVLVLPGSRSRLLDYKLEHNPALTAAVQSGWRIVKFRHIRRLAERQNLTRKLWEALLNTDPPSWAEPTQLPIF